MLVEGGFPKVMQDAEWTCCWPLLCTGQPLLQLVDFSFTGGLIQLVDGYEQPGFGHFKPFLTRVTAALIALQNDQMAQLCQPLSVFFHLNPLSYFCAVALRLLARSL